jgi:hypothetical protein
LELAVLVAHQIEELLVAIPYLMQLHQQAVEAVQLLMMDQEAVVLVVVAMVARLVHIKQAVQVIHLVQAHHKVTMVAMPPRTLVIQRVLPQAVVALVV